MGPSGHFYSRMGLMTRDTGFPRVDELSTDPRELGRHNRHDSSSNISNKDSIP